MEEIQQKLHQQLGSFLEQHPDDGEEKIAHEFGVSRSIVRRWAAGTNFPHQVMCSSVITYLETHLQAGSA